MKTEESGLTFHGVPITFDDPHYNPQAWKRSFYMPDIRQWTRAERKGLAELFSGELVGSVIRFLNRHDELRRILGILNHLITKPEVYGPSPAMEVLRKTKNSWGTIRITQADIDRAREEAETERSAGAQPPATAMQLHREGESLINNMNRRTPDCPTCDDTGHRTRADPRDDNKPWFCSCELGQQCELAATRIQKRLVSNLPWITCPRCQMKHVRGTMCRECYK